jgi:hypothetical protein
MKKKVENLENKKNKDSKFISQNQKTRMNQSQTTKYILTEYKKVQEGQN